MNINKEEIIDKISELVYKHRDVSYGLLGEAVSIDLNKCLAEKGISPEQASTFYYDHSGNLNIGIETQDESIGLVIGRTLR